jgi:hypothetical protein
MGPGAGNYATSCSFERLHDTVAMLSDLAASTSQATTHSPAAFSDDDEPVCARQLAVPAAAGV